MEWKDCINEYLSHPMGFDNITVEHNSDKFSVSPIIKTTVAVLDAISTGSNKSLFVFPEIKELSMEFLIAEVIHLIATGRIERDYDPRKFVKGQKLKFDDCIVRFEEFGTDDFGDYIIISTKEGFTEKKPLKLFPHFQLVESKRLSKYNTFLEAYKRNQRKVSTDSTSNILAVLTDYKTHLGGTVVYVSRVNKTRDYLLNTKINGKSISDLFYLGHITGDGEVVNISSGQMTGNPAIALASDLYSVVNAIDNLKIQAVIFEMSDATKISEQISALDNLMNKGVSITCIADTSSSLDNQELVKRDFEEWRWDKNSITPSLYPENGNDKINARLYNCVHQSIDYVSINELAVSETIELLYKEKKAVQDESIGIITVFEKLFSLALGLSRNTMLFTEEEKTRKLSILDTCQESLKKETPYISAALSSDFSKIISNLRSVVASDRNRKYEYLASIFLARKYRSACMIISDRQDKEVIKSFWLEWNRKNAYPMSLVFMYPQEYQETENKTFDVTIIPGWLNYKLMKTILYHFESEKYIVLTYPHEERWKKAHVRTWEKSIKSSGNYNIIKKYIHQKSAAIDDENRFDYTQSTEVKPVIVDKEEQVDELKDIEEFLLASRYKKYSSSSSEGSFIVDAKPVSYVGGLLAFYKIGHEVITVTDIIQKYDGVMKVKPAEELVVGDFVVVRESERDIIRDMADRQLEREGKQKVRQISQKWKESLRIENSFYTTEEIYERLQKAGSQINIGTLRNWMFDEDLITPRKKEDLIHIAVATNDDVLLEKADLIFAAGKEVKSAHIKAGKILSDKLKESIKKTLLEIEDIDPFNIWDPITLKLDEVGTVKVLKIIDVGEKVQVESANTNRILSE